MDTDTTGPLKIPRMDTDTKATFPEDLIQNILSYLPVKDIVRTSILSRNSRYRWVTVPVLVFDAKCCPHRSFSRSKLIKIIDQVLLLHTGPIDFLYLADLHSVPDIDRWILYASRKSINRLLLEICDGPRYMMPSSLYTCTSLTHLNLTKCVLRPPPSFKGFKSLRWLILNQTTLTEHAFEYLVSSCPSLVKLELLDCGELQSIKIDAPNLEYIDIEGCFQDITFGSVHMKLSEGYIDLKDITSEDDADTESRMTKFFTCLPAIKRLEVKNYFLKYLKVGLIPERLSTPFLDLYHISICIDVKDMDEILAALCLFRSSPNLTELEIEGCVLDEVLVKEESGIWADESSSMNSLLSCCSFDQLRSVKISDVSGSSVELEFIKFLLANSSLLEKMTIVPDPRLSSTLLEKVLRFRKASTRAEIFIL